MRAVAWLGNYATLIVFVVLLGGVILRPGNLSLGGGPSHSQHRASAVESTESEVRDA